MTNHTFIFFYIKIAVLCLNLVGSVEVRIAAVGPVRATDGQIRNSGNAEAVLDAAGKTVV